LSFEISTNESCNYNVALNVEGQIGTFVKKKLVFYYIQNIIKVQNDGIVIK